MRAGRDRPDPGSTATVRDAERLVQVQVGHVRTELPRPRHAHQRVHVRPVHVHLPARPVHRVAHAGDRLLEDAVGGRVRHHDGGQVRAVYVQLGGQVGGVDDAVGPGLHHHDAQARQRRARRVGAVRRSGDEADVTVGLTARGVVGPDREQARELSLRARVRLQRDGVVAGHFRQPALEVADQFGVAADLAGRRERVDGSELRPADRLHLGRRVELHRARAERDHRPVERDVAVGQAPQVPQHRGLALVGVEDGMGEEPRPTPQRGGQGLRHRVGPRARERLHPRERLRRLLRRRAGHRAHHITQVPLRRGLVAGDLHRVRVHQVQVVAGPLRGLGRRRTATGNVDADGVEERAGARVETEPAKGRGQGSGPVVHPARDRRQPAGAMVDRVHGGHHGEQHLRGADVARRLLTPDVLLPRLQREPVGQVPAGVHGHAHQAAGQLPLQVVAHRDVGGVRAAEPDGHPEPLRGADGDVGAKLARRAHQGQRERIGGDGRERAARVRRLDGGPQIAHGAARAGVLQQHTEQIAGQVTDGLRRRIGDDKPYPQRLRAGTQHRERLGQAVGVSEEDAARGRGAGGRRRGTPRQRHRLRGGGRLVEQ